MPWARRAKRFLIADEKILLQGMPLEIFNPFGDSYAERDGGLLTGNALNLVFFLPYIVSVFVHLDTTWDAV